MFKPVSNKVAFPRVEEDVLAFWEKDGTFAKSLKKNTAASPARTREERSRAWMFSAMKEEIERRSVVPSKRFSIVAFSSCPMVSSTEGWIGTVV